MAKRSGGGASRAQRKQARARKHQHSARGLSHMPSEPEVLAVASASAEEYVPAPPRRKLPLPAKVGIFLVLFFVAIWSAAQFRQGATE